MSSSICLKLVSFLRNAATHPLATYPIAEGRGPNPLGRFRHVTALSQPQLTHSPASVEDEDPAAQCVWHHRPCIVSIPTKHRILGWLGQYYSARPTEWTAAARQS